jgi:hypothetical protein
MSDSDSPVRITRAQVLKQFMSFALNAGLSVFFLLGYLETNSDLKNKPISKWLLSHIVFSFVHSIFCALNTFIAIYYLDQIMTVGEWKKKMSTDYYLHNFAQGGYFVTSCYFLHQYVIKNNIYAGYQLSQNVIDAIAIIFIIELAIIGLVIFIAILIAFCYCCGFIEAIVNYFEEDERITHERNTHERNARTVYPQQNDQATALPSRSRSFVRQASVRLGVNNKSTKLQILKSVYSSIYSSAPVNESCSICTDDFSQNTVWKKTPCNHVFHPDCINPWVRDHSNCPNCRGPIPVEWV